MNKLKKITKLKFGKGVNGKIRALAKTLPKNANILDLGTGLGGNSIFLYKQGFRVTCIDTDKEVIDEIKKQYPKINALNQNILDFNFSKEGYDLIACINVLHFLELKDIREIIRNVIKSLKKDGLFFLTVFSKKDPSYSKETKNLKHFFAVEELKKYFSENIILETEDKIIKDNHRPDGKHEHGIIKMLVKK